MGRERDGRSSMVFSMYFSCLGFFMVCRGGWTRCGRNENERRVMGENVVSGDFSVSFLLRLEGNFVRGILHRF